MDPLSVAGLTIGAVSLAFELFSACVKGYNLILEARDMPRACSYLLVRLKMEKDKLIGWAILARVSADDASTGSGLRLSRHTVVDTLREIQVLLLDFSQLDKKYKLVLVPATGATEDERTENSTEGHTLRDDYSALQKKALNIMEKTRRYPRRLQWAAFDKIQFERLVSDLQALNDNMMGFLEANERQRYFQMQEATFMQILQVNNRVGDLFELVHSLRGSAGRGDSGKAGENNWQRTYEERLIRLTRFKAVSIAIESQTGKDGPRVDSGTDPSSFSPSPDPEVVFSRLSKLSLGSEEQQARSLAELEGAPVWLEWKYYVEVDGTDDDNQGPPSFVAQRISRLAKLLGDGEKPAEFLVPDCLGYVHDKGQCRFGYVYRSLPSLDGELPATLFDLLSTAKKPSLTTRVRIARMVATSIWYLHATNWLHKGLRSENIVFQASSIRDASPFLCGFDYSRPASLDEETEQPVENLLHDMYRHPKVQFDVPREGRGGFNKLHDVYGLGVVLYEIAVWKPIYKILGIEHVGTIRASIVKSVRSQLLEAGSIELLECEAGNAVAAAVRTCLDGSLSEDENMLGVDSNARLQIEFGEKVVKRLESVSI